MLAVWRKPPGKKPEGSRVSATSLVVHVVRSKASQHRRSGPLLVDVVPVTTRRVSKAVSLNPPRKRRVNNKSQC
jgi:hypothetical protein